MLRKPLPESREISRQANDRPEFAETRDILRPQNRATARHDNRRSIDLKRFDYGGFLIAKSFLAECGKNLRDRQAERGRDQLIGVVARPAGCPGELPPNG